MGCGTVAQGGIKLNYMDSIHQLFLSEPWRYSFDLILSDPPYSEEDSKIYGCSKYPLGKFMEEARRVLIPGGHLGILHLYYPSHRRKEWSLDALIMVVTGFMRKVRVFSILTKLGVQGELYDLRSMR